MPIQDPSAHNYFTFSQLQFVRIDRQGMTEVVRYQAPNGKLIDCITNLGRELLGSFNYREYAITRVWVYVEGGFVRVQEDA